MCRDEGLRAASGGVNGAWDSESNAKWDFIKVVVLSCEVGIWNERVGGGGDDTEEEFKEVLKCWQYGTWDWF